MDFIKDLSDIICNRVLKGDDVKLIALEAQIEKIKYLIQYEDKTEYDGISYEQIEKINALVIKEIASLLDILRNELVS